MGSSELSDALNPYVSQARARSSTINYPEPLQPVMQPPPQQYIPHRSELELAISEPPPPPVPRTRPSAGGVQAVQDLVRVIHATKEAQEIERKRRLAWEQEQEAKFVQRQAEMERQMYEMREEISTLRSAVAGNAPGPSRLLTSSISPSPVFSLAQTPLHHPASPISPVSQPPSHPQHSFVQGSSNQPMQNHDHYYSDPSMDFQPQQPEPDLPLYVMEQTPSPRHSFAGGSKSRASTPPSSAISRKRRTSELSSDESDISGTSDSSESTTRRPKRRNHHDKRCLTIHHAMRAHTVRLMGIDSDKLLPESHTEGVPLGPDEPVRFVWDKTVKQSVHNTRMKTRVVADLKANRRKYKHVPEKEFGKKTMESSFEQIFTTFRQNFKKQRDEVTALMEKKREDNKAFRARRLLRRKQKLNNRSEARSKVDTFEHVIFDGALQVECMSSEESDFEGSRNTKCLRTRGYLWRSLRLISFYNALDGEEKTDKSTKPKRGLGKKERIVGPPKDGFQLPPKGVAAWMISKRWIADNQMTHPDLHTVLDKLVLNPPGYNDYGERLLALGDESEDEQLQTMQNIPQHHEIPQQHYSTSYSLHNALA